MTDTVQFNIGGTPYKVSRSLIESHPDSMLAKSVSEQWLEDPEAEVFIDRDGICFRFVLNYMRDGKVVLPVTESKESVLAELQYYGIESNETDVSDTNARLSISLESFTEYLHELVNLEKQQSIEQMCTEGAIAILRMYLRTSFSKGRQTTYTDISKSKEPEAFQNMSKLCTLNRTEVLNHINKRLHPVGLNVIALNHLPSQYVYVNFSTE